MKSKEKKKNLLKSLIVLVIAVVVVIVVAFSLPKADYDKIYSLLDKSGYTYTMINPKQHSWTVETDEKGKQSLKSVAYYNLARENILEQIQIVDKQTSITVEDIVLRRWGSFKGDDPIFVARFYRFYRASESEQIYSALTKNPEKQSHKIIRRGKYLFIVDGEEIPEPFEQIIKGLNGKREQNFQ